ncbi:MAG: FMN-binding protein [Kiritimatiellia bacterium]
MRKIAGLLVSLTLIAGVCAAVLAYVNEVTKEAIAAVQAQKTQEAAKAVMPAVVVSVEGGAAGAPFVGKDAAGTACGYAVTGKAGGYGGDVELMVGFAGDRRTVVAYKTLRATETPGLGMKLGEPAFAGQFAGKDGSALKVKKDGGAIEAITSATITSRAVCAAIRDAAGKLMR